MARMLGWIGFIYESSLEPSKQDDSCPPVHSAHLILEQVFVSCLTHFIWLHQVKACGIYFPDQGSNLGAPALGAEF